MASSEADLTEARAVRYFDAARLLHLSSESAAQDYWEPLNHLLGMAAELALKAYLLRMGQTKGSLKQPAIRHNLVALLRLAIANGLKPSEEATEPLLHMSDAHADHSFRYTEKLAAGKAAVIFHAKPEAAIEGIGLLLDQASSDPTSLRRHAKSSIPWPLSLPVQHPITSEQLERWIEEIASYRKFVVGSP